MSWRPKVPDLTKMSDAALIRRMERAGDFKYDDEQVELNRRLEGTGYAWRWSKDFFHPHVIVYQLEESDAA
jgi:hypothetical protein